MAAILVDGLVRQQTVEESTYLFDFEDDLQVQARLRHPTSENPRHKAMMPLYNLMAGFYRAGLDVTVRGPWAEKLPGGGQLRHGADRPRPAFRAIFQDHLPERPPELELAALEAVRRGERPPGLSVARVGKAHCIEGHKPPSCRLWLDYFDAGARPARTWGEAWISLWASARCQGPEALNILPCEIAILHDLQVDRYAIADPSTLADLRTLTFGPGVSQLYDAPLWLQLAESCGEKNDFAMAVRCAEQAVLLDPSQHKELEHWREWLELEPAPPVAVKPVRLRSIQTLLDRLRPVAAAHVGEILDELRRERAEAHDYRRLPCPPRNCILGSGEDRVGLSYPLLTGRDFLEAGLTPAHLAHLGHTANPIVPPTRYPDVFTLRVEKHTLWGNAESSVLLEGTTAYSY